jgi:seryl-tRNA synthetase
MFMIDLKVLRDDPERVRQSQRDRLADPSLVDRLLAADAAHRVAMTRFDAIRNEQKTLGKEIAQAKGDEKQALLEKAATLSAAVKTAEVSQTEREHDVRQLHMAIENLLEAGAPIGGEDDFAVVETVGTQPTFDFPVRDHIELGELLGAIDTERGAKVSGARFYYLTGPGAMLEFALMQHAITSAVRNGFTPMITPVLVKPEAMAGTGYLGVHADEVYHLPADDLYLVGTSEVPLAAYHMNELLDGATLPRRYAAFSSCFRREAGSYGKDTKGIIRVHQFDKVEMFSFCDPADAHDEHLRFLGWEKEFLTSLGLHFRVIDTASGDLGASAARKFDCEAWLPSQDTFREVTSTSNCTDFQARRLGIRMKDDTGTKAVAMLNGTLCAMARMVVMVLENNQRADGSVAVPQVLQGFMGTDVINPK